MKLQTEKQRNRERQFGKLNQSRDSPSVRNRHNPSLVNGYTFENRLREIEMVERRIAPATSVIRESIVWRAEVSCSDDNGAWKTPLVFTSTCNLIARAAAEATVEESSAQSCSVRSISLTVEISITTSTT